MHTHCFGSDVQALTATRYDEKRLEAELQQKIRSNKEQLRKAFERGPKILHYRTTSTPPKANSAPFVFEDRGFYVKQSVFRT